MPGSVKPRLVSIKRCAPKVEMIGDSGTDYGTLPTSSPPEALLNEMPY
jgi:hypothetical protein